MSPIFIACAGILLLGLGLGLGYWFAHSQQKREANRASDVQKELDEYRQGVTEHFSETAQRFQALGQQYQSLYKHMAQGADALCDSAQSDGLLGFGDGNAPEIAISTAVEPGELPEVIRDYATAEEVEPPQAEPEVVVEAAETDEAQEDSTVPEDITVEPPVQEDNAEQVAAPTPIEEERTVH